MEDQRLGEDLDEAFGVVANETRIAILRALWDERTADPEAVDGPRSEPVAFSTLRERVGVADSGQFNYHLGKLVPEFVQHREDGYALTHAGTRVIGAAVSGVYTDTETDIDVTMGECTEPDCPGTLAANYEDGHVTVACDACDIRTVMHAPPVVVSGHDAASNPEVFQQFALTEIQRTVRGFCNLCDGPLEASVGEDAPTEDGPGGSVTVVHVCQSCDSISYTSAAVFLLDHPAFVSLLHEAGIDYRSVPLWQTPPELEWEETLLSTDPVRIEVTATIDGTTLTALLDGDFEVIEYDRRDDAGPAEDG